MGEHVAPIGPSTALEEDGNPTTALKKDEYLSTALEENKYHSTWRTSTSSVPRNSLGGGYQTLEEDENPGIVVE